MLLSKLGSLSSSPERAKTGETLGFNAVFFGSLSAKAEFEERSLAEALLVKITSKKPASAGVDEKKIPNRREKVKIKLYILYEGFI